MCLVQISMQASRLESTAFEPSSCGVSVCSGSTIPQQQLLFMLVSKSSVGHCTLGTWPAYLRALHSDHLQWWPGPKWVALSPQLP